MELGWFIPPVARMGIFLNLSSTDSFPPDPHSDGPEFALQSIRYCGIVEAALFDLLDRPSFLDWRRSMNGCLECVDGDIFGRPYREKTAIRHFYFFAVFTLIGKS
jgi:hypothetical protein